MNLANNDEGKVIFIVIQLLQEVQQRHFIENFLY